MNLPRRSEVPTEFAEGPGPDQESALDFVAQPEADDLVCREHGDPLPCPVCVSLNAGDREGLDRKWNEPATKRQLLFLGSLLRERVIPASETETSDYRKARALKLLASNGYTKLTASKSIEWLLKLPKANPVKNRPTDDDLASLPEVPAGRYALETYETAVAEYDDAGVERIVKFYKVDRPNEGRWAGYTFLSVQASEDFHPIRSLEAKRSILAVIAEDPAAAARLYGQDLGHCGICGRTLTDETSRAYGIGPVCRERTGW